MSEPVKDLEAWLQKYADDNGVFVAMDQPLYSSKFHSFTSMPELKYDSEDGAWCWHGLRNRWIDDIIPENLRSMARGVDYKKVYVPREYEGVVMPLTFTELKAKTTALIRDKNRPLSSEVKRVVEGWRSLAYDNGRECYDLRQRIIELEVENHEYAVRLKRHESDGCQGFLGKLKAACKIAAKHHKEANK